MTDDGQGQEMKGRLKEAAGAVSGDEELKDEGRKDQTRGKLRQAGENLKDAAEDAAEAIRRR
jgi:uncharacterized protein YjbJ (UPF0337 family)